MTWWLGICSQRHHTTASDGRECLVLTRSIAPVPTRVSDLNTSPVTLVTVATPLMCRARSCTGNITCAAGSEQMVRVGAGGKNPGSSSDTGVLVLARTRVFVRGMGTRVTALMNAEPLAQGVSSVCAKACGWVREQRET